MVKILRFKTNKMPIHNFGLIKYLKFLYYWYRYKRKCNSCKKYYLPYPYYQRWNPKAPHYPNKLHCGFCVYDMDSVEQSRLQYEEEIKSWY